MLAEVLLPTIKLVHFWDGFAGGVSDVTVLLAHSLPRLHQMVWVPLWPQHQKLHEDVCQQNTLPGHKSRVAKPAIMLLLF